MIVDALQALGPGVIPMSDPAASVRCMVRASTSRAVERERDDRRLAAQLLLGARAGSVVEVVDRLLAVQAQDLRAARLAIRSRTKGLTAADVDRRLNDRTLLVTWLNRGTLHLVRPDDYWWLQRLTTPQLAAGNAKRLEQEGVSPAQADRGVAVIEAAIAANGPMTRPQLRELVASADVPVAGQAMVHILFLSALRGLTVRGPVIGRDQAFVLVRDWLGDPPAATDRDTALPELARRCTAGSTARRCWARTRRSSPRTGSSSLSRWWTAGLPASGPCREAGSCSRLSETCPLAFWPHSTMRPETSSGSLRRVETPSAAGSRRSPVRRTIETSRPPG